MLINFSFLRRNKNGYLLIQRVLVLKSLQNKTAVTWNREALVQIEYCNCLYTLLTELVKFRPCSWTLKESVLKFTDVKELKLNRLSVMVLRIMELIELLYSWSVKLFAVL